MTQSLPEPHFVDRDPAVILQDCIAHYEQASGRSLTPSQVERLLIDLIAYRESLIRIAIQEAAKQNLLDFARFPMVDYLAKIVGTGRLPATPAIVPLRWTVPASGTERTIPAGTRVRTKDRRAIFALDEDVVIDAADTFADGWGTCEVPGTVGNGYPAGQVTERMGAIGFTVTVSNTATSDGGTASEDTPRLQSRIPTVLDEKAAAGPFSAYRAIARSAHQDVLDVYADSPAPGDVRLVVLVRPGGSSVAVLGAVEEAASAEDTRPATDTVTVEEADTVDYTIEATLTLIDGLTVEEQDAALAASQAAAAAYVAERASGLGRSIVASKLYVVLSVDELGLVESVELTSGGVVVAADKVANNTLIDVALA
jgi:phage-related baseplate assembly protein